MPRSKARTGPSAKATARDKYIATKRLHRTTQLAQQHFDGTPEEHIRAIKATVNAEEAQGLYDPPDE